MIQYRIYREDNYIVVTNNTTQETQYGHIKNVLIDKSNVNKPVYRIFEVKDFDSNLSINISQILKEDGSAYTISEFEDFYKKNTGNFNGGGTAPGVQSVTGSSVDNTDPANPIINAVEEAPEDGEIYGREDGNWVVVSGGLPVAIPDTQSIPFYNMLTTIDDHLMTAPIVIIPNEVGAIRGCGAIQKIIADGVNEPDVSAFRKLSTSEDYLNTKGHVNIFMYYFDGVNYNVGIMQNGAILADVIVDDWASRLLTAGYSISSARKGYYTSFIQTLINAGIYDSITELWMFEGGTASTNVIGFKGNRNLSVNGTITHSSTGSQGNGTTGYFDTGYTPIFIGSSDMHMSIYCRNIGANTGTVIGAGLDTPLRYTFISPRVGACFTSIGGLDFNPSNIDSSGRYIASRKNGTISVSRNNVLNSAIGTDVVDVNNRNIYILALNNSVPVDFSNQEIGFSSIGKSLTTYQISVFDGALSTLLTALGR